MTEHGATCYWQSPPQAPLVREVYFRASKSSLEFTLSAVQDLEARATPAPPPEVTRAKPWWEIELAEAEKRDKGLTFALGERYADMAADLRAKISGETQMIYDYCKGRETFAAFHDCRCVAEHFMDKRAESAAQAPWHQPSEHSLIGMADDVADPCPNRAGVASHEYDQCVGQYGVKLQDGVGAFCTCYADRVADAYMQNPRSQFSNIGGMGAAALLACSEQITPNPLH